MFTGNTWTLIFTTHTVAWFISYDPETDQDGLDKLYLLKKIVKHSNSS